MPPKRKVTETPEKQNNATSNGSNTKKRHKVEENGAVDVSGSADHPDGSKDAVTLTAPDTASTSKSNDGPPTDGNYDHLIRNTSIFIPPSPAGAVNIAVASRALFSLDKEHALYKDKGLDKYLKHQIDNEAVVLEKGSAFPFIQAVQHVNRCLRQIDTNDDKLFNVVLMSHNHAQTGVRLIRSLQHYDLSIQRVCLTGGSNPVDYLQAYNIALYLTSYPEEVEQSLERGFAAAAMLDQEIHDPVQDQLRVAFDLDAVLFSHESDSVYRSDGFDAYIKHEQAYADTPINGGPLKDFASAIGEMQHKFSQNREMFPVSPIRTYIVTARSACVGERAIKTLRSWGLDVDEVHFLSGAPKGPILQAIKPHIFFDDSHVNIESAQEFGAPAAHVKMGAAGYIPKPGNGTKTNLTTQMSFYNEDK